MQGGCLTSTTGLNSRAAEHGHDDHLDVKGRVDDDGILEFRPVYFLAERRDESPLDGNATNGIADNSKRRVPRWECKLGVQCEFG